MMFLTDLPPWLANLIIGIDIVALMGFAAFACVRARISPLWVLGLLIPIINVALIWLAAYVRWPVDKQAAEADSKDPSP
ncbi:MAG: hypothetical protein AAGF58_13460 [Pseudomonadota bacterium]